MSQSQIKEYTVSLERKDNCTVFEAVNASGYSINIDGINTSGGTSVSPVEMLVQAAGACSGVDVLEILKSDSQKIEEFKMQVSATRDMSETPAYLRTLQIDYEITGDILPEKLKRAITLSLEKYCTVGKTLEAFAKIKWSLLLNNQEQTPLT